MIWKNFTAANMQRCRDEVYDLVSTHWGWKHFTWFFTCTIICKLVFESWYPLQWNIFKNWNASQTCLFICQLKNKKQTQKSPGKVSSEFHPLWAMTGRIWFLTLSWVNLCILKLLCALKQHRCFVTWWLNSGADRKVWHLSRTMSAAMWRSERSAVGKLLY